MANGDYGVQPFLGTYLGYQEGTTPAIRFPLTVDAASITASQAKVISIDGSNLTLAPFPSSTSRYALVTISVAAAVGLEWRVLTIDGVKLTRVKLSNGLWALLVISSADASVANFRTTTVDGGSLTTVFTGTGDFRALLMLASASISGTPRIMRLFGGLVAFNSVSGGFALLQAGGVSAPASAPTITSPAANADVADLTPDVTFSAIPGSSTYTYQFGTASDLTGATEVTGATSATVTLTTQVVGSVYVRVKEVNAAGESAYSSIRRFFVAPAALAEILHVWDASLISGADNAQIATFPDAKGGAGYNGTRVASAAVILKTAAQNGLNVLEFTGAAGGSFALSGAGLDLFQNKANAVLIFVGSYLDTAGAYSPFGVTIGGGGTSARATLFGNLGGAGNLTAGSRRKDADATSNVTAAGLVANTPLVHAARFEYDDDDLIEYKNITNIAQNLAWQTGGGAGTNTSDTASTNGQIGAQNGGSVFKGKYFSLYMGNGISEAVYFNIANYAKDKWNLTF